MSDVRDELTAVITRAVNCSITGDPYVVSNAILERFDVTPKPPVTAQSLGGLTYRALQCSRAHPGASVRIEGLNFDDVGERLLVQLNTAGLTIVRAETGE